jgi:hypothetical protein
MTLINLNAAFGTEKKRMENREKKIKIRHPAPTTPGEE